MDYVITVHTSDLRGAGAESDVPMPWLAAPSRFAEFEGSLIHASLTVRNNIRSGLGTDANVSIELHGDKGSVGETRIDNNQNK